MTVRIEQVFQSKTTLYVHYSVINRTGRPYRLALPTVVAATAARPGIALVSLAHTQVDHDTLLRLGDLKERKLTVARSEITKLDLGPGEGAEGVVSIREQLASPVILQLNFQATHGPEGTRVVQATLVY